MTERVRRLNDAPMQPANYVLYWAQMNRRADSNHALAYAAGLANDTRLPLLVYEGLTCSYPHANDRFHTFVLEGVEENQRRFRGLGAGYCFHLRRRLADPDDAFYRLAKHAAAVVTDDYPGFVAREHNARVPAKLPIPYFVVDSSCIVPMNLFEKREYAAYTLRPKIKARLTQYLAPVAPVRLKRKFELLESKLHTEVSSGNIAELVASCEINHAIRPSTAFRGGSLEARRRLRYFLRKNLARYAGESNQPAAHATSNLSPYLHFGHIAAIHVASAVRNHARKHKLIADEFLEELIVRRELAFNFARHTDRLETLDVLPDWARRTLTRHDGDKRPFLYSPGQLERAETHDDLWNATQKEMLLRGKIHGYYRMYWGKKIIEWTPSHAEALSFMISIHDRYALDGRDPNTYSNILWCFGLHDRPWAGRPVFGQIRYMSYAGMKRKTDVDAYIREIRSLEETGKDPLAA
jgi:deoxyribodipyrimidine photo-lyase